MKESPQRTSLWIRSIIAILIILIGLGGILLAPKLKTPPQRQPVSEQAVKVRSITVPILDIIPRIIGYGRVMPGTTWEAVAEVSGQVVWMADILKNGAVFKKGTELLRIEDSDYRLALAQVETQIQASEVKQKTGRDNLISTQKNLELLKNDYKRQKQLADKGMVSQANLEAAEREVLAGQSQVENQQNALDLTNVEHLALLAQREVAKLALERTVITAPMDARVIQVDISVARYANKGQLLFAADGLERAEIEARYSAGALRPLILSQLSEMQDPSAAVVTELKATVRLRTASHMVEWPARVDRVAGSVDPLSQSLGVIVAVDSPYAMARPGERPPLLRDTFVEIELFSSPKTRQVVIPAYALHDGVVYVVNNESRLEMRQVKPAFSLHGYSVIAQGLKSGERIITSDLLFATDGLLLAPQEDKKSKQQLVQIASGKDLKP